MGKTVSLFKNLFLAAKSLFTRKIRIMLVDIVFTFASGAVYGAFPHSAASNFAYVSVLASAFAVSFVLFLKLKDKRSWIEEALNGRILG
jgi:hypothetical protein